MKYTLLFISVLLAFVGQSQATIESCQAMGLPFCSECADDLLQCEACIAGYTVKSDKTGCLKCTDANCVQCSVKADDETQTGCQVCAAGYYLKDADKKCVSCGISNCDRCHMDGDNTIVCDQCQTGYYKSSELQCSACDETCSECDETKCLVCKDSTHVVSGADPVTCAQCPDNCNNCEYDDSTNQTKCTACNDGFYVDNDACSACSATACKTCSSTACYACLDTYVLNICAECPANCEHCDSNGPCTKCMSGYRLDDSQNCQSCPANCDKCSEDTCTACKTGYALTSDGKCVACPELCASCDSNSDGTTTCVTCAKGSVSNNGVCEACPESCKTCDINSDGTKTCITCVEGVLLKNGVCEEPCEEGCDECRTSGDNCITLKVGYGYTSDGHPRYCGEGCLQCSVNVYDIPKCKICATGFLRQGITCHACPPNCAQCTESSTIPGMLECDECMSHFNISNLPCTACPANCASCSGQGENIVCNTCNDDCYMDSDKACHKCFTDCLYCTSATTCLKCVSGKGMPADKSTCTDCATLTGVPNCATCTDATTEEPAKCESCTTGYTMSDDAKECLSMASVGPECTSALRAPPTCTVCQEGAELVSNKCLNCPSNCEKCSEDTCTACKTGYTLTSDGKCVVQCYVCGSSVAECNAEGTEYVDKQQCEYGCQITVIYKNGQMVSASRGCVVNATCLSDGVQQCSGYLTNQNCTKCCDSGDLCNGDYWNPASASVSHVISVFMLLVTLLTAYIFN